jgi:hypothetical protein
MFDFQNKYKIKIIKNDMLTWRALAENSKEKDIDRISRACRHPN